MSEIRLETMDGRIVRPRRAAVGEPVHRAPDRLAERWVAAEQVCWALLDVLEIPRGCDPATSRADNARLERALRAWHALALVVVEENDDGAA